MSNTHPRNFEGFLRRNRGKMTTRWQRFLAWCEMMFVDHGALRLIYSNTHKVAPQVYRTSQPSPSQIARLARRRGIKTVLNLRGARDSGEYLLQKEACAQLGIKLVDFPLSSRSAPRPSDARKLKEIFETIEYPVLMHCKSGADRAGLGAALYLHLREGKPVTEAAKQLHWTFGHWSHARTGILDYFFRVYDEASKAKPLDLILWSESDYDPVALARDFKPDGWSSFFVDRILRRE